jgi:2,4-dienoyl-CoA reductase-like NADH-dependent reductase (Old Yellow Enzyme family)
MHTTPHLFAPTTLAGLTLPNRIVIAPMCQYSAIEGSATDWHMAHLGQLMMSGAGLLILEATAVSAIGRITPGCLGLYNDANASALEPIMAGLRKISHMPIGMQLAHAGRKASSGRPWEGGKLVAEAAGGWHPVAPSATPITPDERAPIELSKEGIKAVIQEFVSAAKRADALGIDCIELHGAHGYLGHQFLSPVANQRTDEYGGSLENRMRFLLEQFRAVREVWPESKPLGVRLSSTDWLHEEAFPSWDLEQTLVLGAALKDLGVDFLHLSSGGISPKQKIAVGPGYQVSFAERIKREVGVPTIAVGMITEAQQANQIIETRQADMVALARGFLYNPRWAWHAAAELGASIEAPRQYWRSQPAAHKMLFGQTSFGQR